MADKFDRDHEPTQEETDELIRVTAVGVGVALRSMLDRLPLEPGERTEIDTWVDANADHFVRRTLIQITSAVLVKMDKERRMVDAANPLKGWVQ